MVCGGHLWLDVVQLDLPQWQEHERRPGLPHSGYLFIDITLLCRQPAEIRMVVKVSFAQLILLVLAFAVHQYASEVSVYDLFTLSCASEVRTHFVYRSFPPGSASFLISIVLWPVHTTSQLLHLHFAL